MIKKRNDITAVILAGGKSSRMGSEKALLKINDITLIERAISICKIFFNEVLISTNDKGLFNFAGIVCISDIYPNLGPISGIHAGLIASETEKIFVLSIDTVFDDPNLIKEMIVKQTYKPIVLPLVSDIPQYVFGIYSKSILPKIEEKVKEKSPLSPKIIVKEIETELINFEKMDFFDRERFFNINTLEDYERAKKIFR